MHVRDIIQNQERLCTSGQLEHNKRNFISTSNHVFFVYHINTKALYWQEKSPLLMNENKRIDNPWIRVVKCVDALKMKTCLKWLQKQTVGLISNIKNSLLLNFVLNDRRNLSGIGPWQIFQPLIFVCIKIVVKLWFRDQKLMH